MSLLGLFLDLHVCAGRSEDEASSHASFIKLVSGGEMLRADERVVGRDIRGGGRAVWRQAASAFTRSAETQRGCGFSGAKSGVVILDVVGAFAQESGCNEKCL